MSQQPQVATILEALVLAQQLTLATKCTQQFMAKLTADYNIFQRVTNTGEETLGRKESKPQVTTIQESSGTYQLHDVKPL